MFCRIFFILCIFVCASIQGDIIDIKDFHKKVEERKKLEELKATSHFEFPTDCGYSPTYPRPLIGGSYRIEPDEFSWVASLVYEKNKTSKHCSGAVISSRYVLTAGNCVAFNRTDKTLGSVIGVRLGDFENQSACDYGTEDCQRFQYFDIKEKLVHSDYKVNPRRENDIALLKLDRDIVFGAKMQPVCLPFGKNNNISEPHPNAFLMISGWWTAEFPKDGIGKRSLTVSLSNTTVCTEAADKDTQLCGMTFRDSPCPLEYGSPLMNMFLRKRLVLEGIAYNTVGVCPSTNVTTLYTNVRIYEKWIENSIKKLEYASTVKVA